MSMPVSISLNRSYSEPVKDHDEFIGHPQYSSSYPPAYKRYNTFNWSPTRRKYYQKVTRKCSYIIALVETELFTSCGAEKISNGIYVLPRIYDGTSTGETCAIIGLNREYVKKLFEDVEKDGIYDIVKNIPQLKHVPGIKDLELYRMDAFRCMLKFLYFVCDSELILFNIEPKGDGKIMTRYPCANMCLPGGGMEIQDGQCWVKTGLREFEEETGFVIFDSKVIAQQKFVYPDRHCMYFWYRVGKLSPIADCRSGDV